jgi:DNA protecting protein DprA
MIIRTPFHQFKFNFLEIETQEETSNLLNTLPENGLAIVGTRYPQHRSFKLLEKTMKDLQGSNLVIVSGFARGIDSRAHELAIENGLKTIAILGCGLNIDYPKENWLLRKKILNHGGMIISPFDSNTAALPHNFLNRNKLIAYFSKAVWIVEAAAISGSLSTAKHASDLNRDLYTTPSFPDDPFFEGNQKLLSHECPDRYPFSDPFYGINSLLNTWNHLKPKPNKVKKIDRKNMSRIQKWVLDLSHEQGECRIQSLMNHATSEGLSPGEFYLEFKKELDAGTISEDQQGKVHLK